MSLGLCIYRLWNQYALDVCCVYFFFSGNIPARLSLGSSSARGESGLFSGKKKNGTCTFCSLRSSLSVQYLVSQVNTFFFHNRALKTMVFGVIKNLIVARVGLLWSLTAAWYVCNVGWVSAVLPVPGVPYMPEVGYSFKTVLVHNLLLCGFVLLF